VLPEEEDKMRRTLIAVAALAGSVLLGAGSCEDPCAKLGAPTAVEVNAANGGAEVEREVNGSVDCELVNGRWVREQD
jgi:hypothetical protein